MLMSDKKYNLILHLTKDQIKLLRKALWYHCDKGPPEEGWQWQKKLDTLTKMESEINGKTD
jgi:hypothetical protein